MALTNYLTATVLVLVIGRLLGDRPETWSTGTVLGIAGGILTVQWLWSTRWLRSWHYGPLEWLWRWANWMRRPPLRRPHQEVADHVVRLHARHSSAQPASRRADGRADQGVA